jgi:hypothetical protein
MEFNLIFDTFVSGVRGIFVILLLIFSRKVRIVFLILKQIPTACFQCSIETLSILIFLSISILFDERKHCPEETKVSEHVMKLLKWVEEILNCLMWLTVVLSCVSV